MKKLLYVASSYGHILSFHIPYIKRLQQMGFEVHAAGAGASDGTEPRDTKKINIPFEKSMFSIKNISCTFQLMKLIKEERYDVISVHTSLAAFFVRVAVMLTHGPKPTVINTVHGYLFDERTPRLKRSLLLWAEKLTKPVTNIVAVMNDQDYQIAEKYHLYKDKLVQIPGFGIDIDHFSRAAVEEKVCRKQGNGEQMKQRIQHERDKLGIKTEDILLIYAAEFSKRKNQKMLIEAMAKLPSNVKLILAGKGEMLEECKQLAETLWQSETLSDEGITETDSRVLFLGHVKKLEYFYYLSDICVSASRSEGLPFNIMEAMAMGLPVVATDVKGHQDLVEKGINGYLYEFNDQQGFVNAIMKIIHMEQKDSILMSQNNISKAEKYGLKKVMDEVLAVYDGL
ncbi:glycosyltransferase family 4 protein [Aminipila luticellarii]|uniref:Glycosyltransferase family 1 protein n=1 Tax=Aminipila luticellarii TaxID=2507160 RepID=A0A410PSP0_9FIRM|nr:glycosyltransferase family 4 protein [Aminipila luticellarii]QAT41909.1 glycosyltransferase family 1 protein [Aminipila luticellarii]